MADHIFLEGEPITQETGHGSGRALLGNEQACGSQRVNGNHCVTELSRVATSYTYRIYAMPRRYLQAPVLVRGRGT